MTLEELFEAMMDVEHDHGEVRFRISSIGLTITLGNDPHVHAYHLTPEALIEGGAFCLSDGVDQLVEAAGPWLRTRSEQESDGLGLT